MLYTVEISIRKLQQNRRWDTVFQQSLQFKNNIWLNARRQAISRYLDFKHDPKLDHIFDIKDTADTGQLKAGDHIKDVNLSYRILGQSLFLSEKPEKPYSQLDALQQEARLYIASGQLAHGQLHKLMNGQSIIQMVPDSNSLVWAT